MVQLRLVFVKTRCVQALAKVPLIFGIEFSDVSRIYRIWEAEVSTRVRHPP